MPIDPRIWGFSPDMGGLGETLAGGVTNFMDNRRYADAFKDGDYEGAFNKLLKAGDLEGAAKIATIYNAMNRGNSDLIWDVDAYGRVFNKRTGDYKQPSGGVTDSGGASPVSGAVNPDYTPHRNVDEGKAASFHKEAALANDELSKLGDVPNQEGLVSGVATGIEEAAEGGIIGGLARGFKSSERGQFDNAASRFINAINRRESGTQVKASEYRDAYARYLPLKGDGPEVLAQKAAARQAKINAISGEAGPMYDPQRYKKDAAPTTNLAPGEVQASLDNARAAIAKNPAIRGAVIQRLLKAGIDPSGL